MNPNIKRVSLGALTLALLAMPIAGMADDVTSGEGVANIHAPVADANAMGTAYKIININWDAESKQFVEPQFTWVPEVQE